MTKVESLDIVAPEELAWLQNDMAKRIESEGQDLTMNPEHLERRFGRSNNGVLDRRVVLDGRDPAYQLVEKIVRRRLPPKAGLYIAYQRQMMPHHLHVDPIITEPDPETCFSLIIPMMDDPEFKTIVWKKQYRSWEDVNREVVYFKDHHDTYQQQNNLSKEHHLGHCYQGDPMFTDYMELDGIYQYKLGTVGMFPRLQMHASNNWLKCERYQHKDIIIVHAA